MRIEWLSAAFRDLNSAIEYLDQQEPGLGEALLAEVDHAVTGYIVRSPKAWPVVLKHAKGHPIRRYLTARFHYHIRYTYLCDKRTVVILSIVHSKQDPQTGLERVPEIET